MDFGQTLKKRGQGKINMIGQKHLTKGQDSWKKQDTVFLKCIHTIHSASYQIKLYFFFLRKKGLLAILIIIILSGDHQSAQETRLLESIGWSKELPGTTPVHEPQHSGTSSRFPSALSSIEFGQRNHLIGRSTAQVIGSHDVWLKDVFCKSALVRVLIMDQWCFWREGLHHPFLIRCIRFSRIRYMSSLVFRVIRPITHTLQKEDEGRNRYSSIAGT